MGILKDSLPIEAANRGRGRRPDQDRSIIDAILWRLRRGTPWRDVPPKYGNWNTIYRRFRGWNEAGVGKAVAVTLAEAMADSGQRPPPWIAGIGPLLTTSTRAWRCASFNRARGPGAWPSSKPSGP